MSIAVARTRTYELLGELLLGEAHAIARARQTAPLSEALGAMSDTEVRSAHHRIFGLEAFPYAGVYTEREPLVGGRIADHISTVANRAGIAMHASESVDHVGNIARLVGRLLRKNDRVGAQNVVLECLVPWLAPWYRATERVADGFWLQVSSLLVELVVDHVGDALSGHGLALASPFSPHDGMSVRAIAKVLVTPSRSGALLCRQDIRDMGRQLELPTGFGSRELMLSNLLRAGADYERGPVVLAALASFFADQSNGLGPARRLEQTWRERAKSTGERLESMGGELAGALATVG